MEKKFDVSGMTCSSCVANVTKAVEKLDGVTDANVNLMTNSMKVSYDENKTNDKKIISAVEKIGYGAKVSGEKISGENKKEDREGHLKNRLISSLVFMVILMYIAMGPMIHLPTPGIFHRREGAIIFAFSQFLLALPVVYINREFYISGFRGLKNRAPNMDSLVAIGSLAALVYGIFAIYMMAYGFGQGDMELVDAYRHNLYFESSAMILTLITVGKYLEEKSKNKTRSSLANLMDLAPKMATVIEDGEEVVKNIEDVRVGDILIVRPGESVAVDGKIIEGASSLDESAVTGESIPVQKSVGDRVISASINTTGSFKFQAEKVGEDTTISQIIKLVDEANQSKAPIAKLADEIAGVFVPAVLIIAALTFGVWMALGYGFENALNFAISVLVISCPCALGLATPVSIMVATGKSADFGLLFKNAEVLENLHKIDVIVMDKTGTITEGKPILTDIVTDLDQDEFLKIAGSIEKNSQHPLASAIINYAQENDIDLEEITNFNSVSGRGLNGEIAGNKYLAGNIEYMLEENIDLKDFKKKAEELAGEGKTSMYFANESEVLGIISVKDIPKKSSKDAIKLLRGMGKKIIMLTGDNEKTAEAIADEIGVDQTLAGLLPQDKNKEIDKIQKSGKKVLMIGDGINDAPSLAKADIGMAIGHGTDVAIESSDVVLMRSDLLDVVSALELSKATIKNIKQNLFWAFFYNTIGIPLAAGLLFPAFGIKLSPMFAALAMSLSSVFVVNNALRLRRFKPRGVKRSLEEAKPSNEKEIVKEENPIEKNEKITKIKVEGMMCEHCEKRVSEALEKTGKVKDVLANYQEGTVKFVDSGITAEEIKKAVEEAGYKIIKNKGEDSMEKILNVEGMSCMHCVAHVKEALEKLEGVREADVKLEEKRAEVKMDKEVSDDALIKAVEGAGYSAKIEK
ncbi:heavy metal translocating P-type ATPase [uncultured Peptoniphilus sp.]|uniref:heavy metal translocating P-type ATPase n=1 Tax=uncultured Peptoniphilus sp. TaxID=254354 RepID=UPI00258FBB36|nr:heavy metal translocating P-type ATPase [uncultured Peptoniphilus sp.]MDU6784213.1 heavy metal translocating P-type ATPase [Peptoniphilus harei]